MKTYQAIFNEEDVDGVFAISLVHNPAMKGAFVALNKHEIQLKEIDKEQRILIGLVLEPNKPIFRNQNGEEFNIVFNEDTIKNLSYHFFKSNYHKNSTIEHEESQKIEGVTFVESWIVRNPKRDASNEFGLEYPKGSWIAAMKVDSDDIWENYIKTGKVKGFSIDGMLSLKEVNTKSNINMSEIKEALTAFKDDLLVTLNLKEKEGEKEEAKETFEVKLGSVKTQEGDVVFEYEGETPAEGSAIWVTAEDGTRVPVPVGQYTLEDGSVLVVSEEGVIASVGQPEVEEAEAEMEAETASTGGADIVKQVQESIKSIMIKYNEENAKKLEEIKAEFEKQILELKEQPAAKKIKSKPVQVELTNKGRLLEKLRNNKNN
jgi:hypothetical protein